MISWPYSSGPLNVKSLWRVAPDFCLLLSLRHHLMALRFLSSPECTNFPASSLCNCVGILSRPNSLSGMNVHFFPPLYRQLSSYQFFMSQERLPLSPQAHRLTPSSLTPPISCVNKSHQLFLLKAPNPRYHFLWHPWTPVTCLHCFLYLPEMYPTTRLMSSKSLFSSQSTKCQKSDMAVIFEILQASYILRIRAKYSQLPIMSWHPRASHPAPQFRLHTASTCYASAVLAHLFHRTTCTSLLGAFVLCCRTLLLNISHIHALNKRPATLPPDPCCSPDRLFSP